MSFTAESVACEELSEWLEAEYEASENAVSLINKIREYASVCGMEAPIDRLKTAMKRKFSTVILQDNPDQYPFYFTPGFKFIVKFTVKFKVS